MKAVLTLIERTHPNANPAIGAKISEPILPASFSRNGPFDHAGIGRDTGDFGRRLAKGNRLGWAFFGTFVTDGTEFRNPEVSRRIHPQR